MRLPRRRYRAVIYSMPNPAPDTTRHEYKLPWRWKHEQAMMDLGLRIASHYHDGAYDWFGYVEARS